MSNLSLLINTNLINDFGFNKIRNSETKDKVKIASVALMFITCFVFLGYYIFKMCFMLSDLLLNQNKLELLLVLGFISGVLFSLITSIYKVPSYLFNSKDFELLRSLPIKESTILTSKIIMLVFTNYLFLIPCMFIPGIVYFIKSDISWIFFVYLACSFLVTPLIPIIISSVISFFIGNISSKFKYKNAILIVGSIALLVAYIAMIGHMDTIAQKLLENSSSIIEAVSKLYPPVNYYVEGLQNNSFLDILMFIVISIVPFIIFIILFAKIFKTLNSKMNESYKANNYELRELKTSSSTVALITKEFNRYFSSYIYVLNTSIGVILLPIFSIAIVVFGAEKINLLLNLNIDTNMIKPQIILMVLFMIITSCTTHCSISLEGKNLWVLKSLPIKVTSIFKSKIFMNLILITPVAIVSFIPIAMKLKFDTYFIMIMTATILAVSIFTALIGIIANLIFPNLEWKNEVAVVKTSISVMVTIFGSMIYLGSFVFISYFIKIEINQINMYLLVSTIITFTINIFLWMFIKTKGVKIFKNL